MIPPKRKDHGTVEGGPDKPPEKPGPPVCPLHKRPGRYLFQHEVACDYCDAGFPPKAASADFTDEEVTADTTPSWYGVGWP